MQETNHDAELQQIVDAWKKSYEESTKTGNGLTCQLVDDGVVDMLNEFVTKHYMKSHVQVCTDGYPQKQPVCLQQGGATLELYVQLPECAAEYVQECEDATYKAVDCGEEIEILGKLADGTEVVTLQEAVSMAQSVVDSVEELIIM